MRGVVRRVALPGVTTTKGGDGWLAQRWPTRGGCHSLVWRQDTCRLSGRPAPAEARWPGPDVAPRHALLTVAMPVR